MILSPAAQKAADQLAALGFDTAPDGRIMSIVVEAMDAAADDYVAEDIRKSLRLTPAEIKRMKDAKEADPLVDEKARVGAQLLLTRIDAPLDEGGE